MYVIYGVLVIAMLLLQDGADEVVRPMRPRAGPGRVGLDNSRS